MSLSDTPPTRQVRDAADEDDDAVFAELEKEADDNSAYRAHRLEQLKAEFKSKTSTQGSSSALANAHPTSSQDRQYPTISSDKAILDLTTEASRCVVHFAHPDFARCGIMDQHLQRLAALHHEVRFARVDVRNTPFVVEKLKVRVLPYVIGFKDGVAVERVMGFEGLGSLGQQADGVDGFSTRKLERRLFYKGVLGKIRLGDEDGHPGSDVDEDGDRRTSGNEHGVESRRRAIRSGSGGGRKNGQEDDEDDDWD